MSSRTVVLTALAMIAFASNSLLCRAALKQTPIDAATFILIRILFGAAALWIVISFRSSVIRESQTGSRRMGDWWSAFALFAYAAGFSFAYNTLAAGTGALLLFGAVQATMIFWGIGQGERLRFIQLLGIAVAAVGLVVLLLPGLSAPPLVGSVLMLGAGIAWGAYSLRGKAARNATAATAGNFFRAVPFAVLASVASIHWLRLDARGIVYAAISGAITSGLGYVIWYSVLSNSPDDSPGKRGLSATTAATVQLSVPVLAATGGILFLHEPLTVRYLAAAIAVLGGIFLVVIERRQPIAAPVD